MVGVVPEDACVPIREVSSFQRVVCTGFNMELGPEDVPLLERCPHLRGWYVQASIWSWDLKMYPY